MRQGKSRETVSAGIWEREAQKLLLKKLSGMNYFVALIILLGVIFVLGLTALILVASFPGALGSEPPCFEIKEVYNFEPWFFEFNGLNAAYPEGGMIIPLFREDKQEAALLIGPGEYSTREYALPSEEPLGIFLMVNNEIFSELRGDTIFMPVLDAADRNAALVLYERQPGLPVLWQKGIPLVFNPVGSTLYYYFLDSTGDPVLPPALIEPAANLYGTMALYILFIVVVLLTILIFSLDHHPSRYWKFIHCARPGWPVAAAAVGAAAFALLSEMLPALTQLNESIIALGYAAAMGGLILLARYDKLDFLDFGLRPDMLRHGYLMVAATTALYMVMTRGIPEKLAVNGFSTLLDFLILFILVALAREMIWRGYIQTALGRQLGAIPGLIITSVLAGMVHYVVILSTSPWLLAYPYTAVETVVLVPGTALVLGLIYLRTENIISSALLHSLILFLPRIFVN
jgi:membrane protease YdiL (CAAX protease family)